MKEKLLNMVFGTIQSWTAWLGLAVMSLPDWWPIVQEQLPGLLDEDSYGKVVRFMGMLVILVRFKTTKSIAEKGKAV